ncbi:aspartic peptidase domain-containing protein [Suillus spraguei]|nr:aspartic peptidase domain-containing protein [Suillus spraguei]
MFLAASLLTVFLPLSITGSPVVEVRDSLTVTLPLTRRLNFSDGTIEFLQRDETRVAAFRNYGTHSRRADSILVTTSFLDYQVQVGIGEPPTIYNLAVDTGSPITWVGASTIYKRTGTSVMSGLSVMANYGDQATGTAFSFSGPIFYDTVTLGGGLTVTWFQLAVAFTLQGFDFGRGFDGILGIAPEDLSRGIIENDQDATIPSFTECLYLQGKIGRQVVGVFFQPVTREPDSQFGELTFGGTDSTKHDGNFAYTPITATPPSSLYWGINQRITYDQTTILGFTAGIVDTGTTFLYLASDAFHKYQAATGATRDQTTRLLRISPNRYNTLQNLDFHIGYTMISLTPDAQIWPRSLNTVIPGGVVGAIYLIVKDIEGRSGRGFDFILGYTFIQRFYTVFDSSRSLVGFASTPFTSATTNILL